MAATTKKVNTVWGRQRLSTLLVPLVLIGVVVGLFTPVVYYVMPQTLDYPWHIESARRIAEEGQYRLAHPAYQWLVILVKQVLFLKDYTVAGHTAAVLCYVALSLILYRLLLPVLSMLSVERRAVAAGLLVLGLMIATPVTLLRPDNSFYWGYVFITVYHNPTYVLLQPVVLLLFWQVVTVLHHDRVTVADGLIVLVLSALSTLSKPNYTVVLLPALLLIVAFRVYRTRRFGLLWLLAFVFTPSVIILAIQYNFNFTNGPRQAQIMLVPFHFFANRPTPIWMLPKFIFSILFPLCVYLGYWRSARRDLSLNAAWLMFAIGASYAYLLVEGSNGRVAGTGNWLWSAGITSFVLFVASTRFFFEQNQALLGRSHPRAYPHTFWIGSAALLLHMVGGIIWFSLYAPAWQIPWGQFW
jgi:hypothetical protein